MILLAFSSSHNIHVIHTHRHRHRHTGTGTHRHRHTQAHTYSLYLSLTLTLTLTLAFQTSEVYRISHTSRLVLPTFQQGKKEKPSVISRLPGYFKQHHQAYHGPPRRDNIGICYNRVPELRQLLQSVSQYPMEICTCIV